MSEESENKAEILIDYLRKGKGIFDAFDGQFKNGYLISGKTIINWTQYFKVEIPNDIDLNKGKILNSKIAQLTQEAAFYLAASDAVLKAIQQGSMSEYQTKFTALVAMYTSSGSKLPAQKTLETLANQEFDDVKAAETSARIAHEFWEHIVKSLERSRKSLENIGMLLNAEAKLNPKNY